MIYLMANPVYGGPLVIGTASEVCTELWGKVKSGYPKNIPRALQAAREGVVFRGYTLTILTHKPTLLTCGARTNKRTLHSTTSLSGVLATPHESIAC